MNRNYVVFLLFFLFSLNLFTVSYAYAQEDEEVQVSEQEDRKTEEDKKAEEEERSLTMAILLYPASRVLDFIDIFRLNVAAGPGIGLNIRPTKFLQIGAETYVSARLGLGKKGSLVFKRYGLAYLESEVLTMGVGPLYTGGKQRGYTEVGGTAHLVIVGAEAALDLSEIADFFLGFTTYDFKDDDL